MFTVKDSAMKTIAIELNNVGCLYLDRGYHNEAIPFLQKGINFVVKTINGRPLPSEDQLQDILRNIVSSAIECGPDKCASKSEDQHSCSSICRQSFRITLPLHDEMSDGCSDLEEEEEVSITMDYIASRLLYNRALAMHVQAIEKGKGLDNVANQYGCVKDLLDGSDLMHDKDSFLIFLATLNNEAICYYEHFQYDRSFESYEELGSMLDYHCTFNEPSSGGEIESLCSLNCFIYREPPSTARAA